jgi:hypothetical protein
MSFYFLTEFFKYFFRVLNEASSSWLKLCWFILGHLYKAKILAGNFANPTFYLMKRTKIKLKCVRNFVL